MEHKHITIFQNTGTEDYLKTAIETAKYIKRHEINTPEGRYWEISGMPDKKPDAVERSFLNQRSLYAGSAGIGYFFLQLYEATGQEAWLSEAVAAGEYLTATYETSMSSNPGIHAGSAGEGVFLDFLYEKTGNQKYKTQMIRIAEDIYHSAIRDESGTHWNGFFDLMGDGGAVLYWLLVAKRTRDTRYYAYAKEVLDSLLRLRVPYGENAVYWRLFDPHIYFKSVPEGGIVPNFAHGTAGVVYLLTKYYEATREALYLEEAEKGYRFLRQIAIEDGDAAIVPYIYLEEEKRPYDVMYLGYCHGPVGDGIAIYALYQATGKEEYLNFYKQLTNALIAAGVPEKRSAGYWNDCLCCGSAGALLHFLKAADIAPAYLQYAIRTADKSVADAYKDQEGYRWYNAWTRIKPWDVDAHLGLYVGAAGSASALLSLYAKQKKLAVTPLWEYAS